MVVGEVVGVGIFLTPATMMRTLGSPGLALAMWLLMGALSLAGALCYAELSTRFPRAGGAYVYLREAFGPRAAFLYGWMALLVVDPGLTAALGIGLAQYLLAATGGSADLVPVVAVASIAAFGGLTLAGVGASARVLRWTAAAKLVMVALLVAAGALHAMNRTAPLAWPASTDLAPEAVAASVIAAFFAFGGWWDLGRMSEEVAEPRRTMPRALVGGIALVTLVYAMVTLAFVLAAPAPLEGEAGAFVNVVGARLFGPAAARLLAVMVVVAVSGSLAAVLLGAPRVYLAMARDRVFPAVLARLDERRGASVGATLVQVTLACLLAMLGTFDAILGYFVPTAVFFLGLSAAGLMRLPRPAAGAAVFRTPGYPVPLAVFLVLIAGMLVLFAAGQPRQTLLGAAIVLLGVPVSRYVVRGRNGVLVQT